MKKQVQPLGGRGNKLQTKHWQIIAFLTDITNYFQRFGNLHKEKWQSNADGHVAVICHILKYNVYSFSLSFGLFMTSQGEISGSLIAESATVFTSFVVRHASLQFDT